MLISAGAKLDLKDNYGVTALCKASENNQFKICRLLVEAGAKIGLRDCTHQNAKDYALKNQNKELIEVLSSRRQA